MPKKCVPGVICIDNMTVVLIFILIVISIYLYSHLVKSPVRVEEPPRIASSPFIANISTRHLPKVILDPYGPPLKNDGIYFPSDSNDIRGIPLARPLVVSGGIPINMETRGLSQDYTQVGILTRDKDDLILSLMGRRLTSGTDKWQYYTISNTGNMNTKLPITVRGKSGSGEYGCDVLMNGDTVFVEGYKDVFRATIYENGTFSYIPYI